jgi:MFS family permease
MDLSPQEPDEERPASSAPDEGSSRKAKRDPFAAWRHRDYRLYACGGLIAAFLSQMSGVAVGWELYERTRSPLALGIVGLVEALPIILLALPAGQAADRFPRRVILLCTATLLACASLFLAWTSYIQGPVSWMYGALLVMAIGRSLEGPARSAWLFQLVPPQDIPSAVTWNSSRWQLASMAGPALGGLVLATTKQAWPLYMGFALGQVVNALTTALIKGGPQERLKDSPSIDSLLAGWRYVRGHRLILSTITLDMFAVFLGGAVALLPVFARDVLHLDASGLGWLRAAPAIGALCMGLSLAALPPIRRAGALLLWSVAGFGLAMMVFALSRSFVVSFVALLLSGALDNISVVIRHTLVQVLTPDEMRGRVSAINSVFIGTSNELGDFESGLMARLVGAPLAVLFGGLGTLGTVALTGKLFPELLRLDTLDGSMREAEESKAT